MAQTLVPYLCIITVFSVFSRYNALKEDPLGSYQYSYSRNKNNDHNNYFEGRVFLEAGGHDPQAYPSYISTNIINEGGYNFEDLMMSPISNKVVRLEKLGISSTSPKKVINVNDFGATADGTDDTQAFEKAWEEACASKGAVVLQVPKGRSYLLKPIRFSGPCTSNLTLQIYGSMEASDDRSDYEKDSRHWLRFDNVDNLLIDGGGDGTINGNGNIWWQSSCKVNQHLPCKDAPTAVTFYNSKNLVVQNLKIQNAQQIHVSFEDCTNVQASGVSVTAPETSPNTDGIHVARTQNIIITKSVIGTGDDCISIVNGSQNVVATDITCGPGHGISIGSLGSNNEKAYVSGVTVDGAKLSGTTNGVRIKTWQGGLGSASNIKFQNIEMNNVTNPIIIDQNYCDQDEPCKEQSSAVQVKNVLYKNIKGTSASEVAIKFDCSKSYPCLGIVVQNIMLQQQGDKTAKAICNNVNLIKGGTVSPQCP